MTRIMAAIWTSFELKRRDAALLKVTRDPFQRDKMKFRNSLVFKSSHFSPNETAHKAAERTCKSLYDVTIRKVVALDKSQATTTQWKDP